jgi:hypothetical protein
MADELKQASDNLLKQNDGERIPVLEDVVLPGVGGQPSLDEELLGLEPQATRGTDLPADADLLARRIAADLAPLVAERAREAVHESMEQLAEQVLERTMFTLRSELEELIRERARALSQAQSVRTPSG